MKKKGGDFQKARKHFLNAEKEILLAIRSPIDELIRKFDKEIDKLEKKQREKIKSAVRRSK